MPDRFQTQLQRGTDRLFDVSGRTVTYTRGSRKASLQVVAGQTISDTLDSDNLVTRVITRDYTIRKADFEAAGFVWPPERGDLIRDTNGTYQCLPMTGEGEVRDFDTDSYSCRTHWKRTAT